jgi:cytochrome oxidase Cu insertion factor (SCO1/SenC/PrrC family)
VTDRSAEPARPFYKNPFVIGFVVGIAALTALPLMQRKFLKAPPPLRPLGTWELTRPDGEIVRSEALKGKVLVTQALPADCMPGCNERVEAQASLLRHFDDLGGKVMLVTFVVPAVDAPPFARTFVAHQSTRWVWLSGEPDAVDKVVERGFLQALTGWSSTADAGTTSKSFSSLPSFSLVDQNGEVRGFWTQDDLGRGNLINAARLLARFGPSP